VWSGFPATGPPEVSVYGKLPFSMAPGWTAVIAPVDSDAADVALLSTLPTSADGQMRMKLIAANRRYRTFGTQTAVPVALPVDPGALAIVHDRGAPVLLVLERRARRLLAVGLWPTGHRR
jgi:hypothetical protein